MAKNKNVKTKDKDLYKLTLKNPGGRPTKYYPEVCKELIEWTAKTRLPLVCFAAHLCISEDTLYEWSKQHREFSEAKKIAKSIMKGVFTERATHAVMGRVRFFNMGAFAMIMKNCYGWKDNPEPAEDDIEDMIF